MNNLSILLVLFADLPPEAVAAEIAITAQVVRIESVIPLPDDFGRKEPLPKPDRPTKPEPTPSPHSLCDCGGTGFVTDQKQWKRVRCQCGTACKCGSKGIAPPSEEIYSSAVTAKQRENYGVMIGASWCGPCVSVKTNELPKLATATWSINKGPASHFITLDFDKDRVAVDSLLELPGAPESIVSLPTFLRIESGRITATQEGAMNATSIARFVYPALAPATEPIKASTGEVCPRCGKVHSQQLIHTRPGKQFLWRTY